MTIAPPRLVAGPDQSLAPWLAAALDSLLRATFAGAGINPTEPATWRVVLVAEQQVLATAAYRVRAWSLPGGGGAIHGGLVGYIATDPAHRGQGHAGTVLQACMSALAAHQQLPGILTCVESLVAWYARYGWQTLCHGACYNEADGTQRLDPDPVLYWGGLGHGAQLKSLGAPFPIGSDW